MGNEFSEVLRSYDSSYKTVIFTHGGIDGSQIEKDESFNILDQIQKEYPIFPEKSKKDVFTYRDSFPQVKTASNSHNYKLSNTRYPQIAPPY